MLTVSRRTLVNWECAYWLPPRKQRVQLVLALRAVPPEHVLNVAESLGLTNDDAVAPLLAQFERALEGEAPPVVAARAPATPPPPPRPTPEALRAAVDAVVHTSADALDVRASDLRAAVTRVLAACGDLGANLDETRGAVASVSPQKAKRG